MDLKQMYREIVNEHNLHPTHKHDMENPTMVLRGVNPSCGDDISLKLKVEDGVIKDGSFVGSGCAISQASADMMLDLVIGKSEDEAKRLAEIFMNMIKGKASEEEIEELDEAAALEDVSHMPARVKCAQLGWRTLNEMMEEDEKNDSHKN
ncbi:MAG: SUF system NifU family Fe-S cluster assembly protein [Lachnospiraceae bacterium]|jgi:nitrogen fixation NifU-like protein|nr:SUF system NifU family Fe-S cluster assembly protein [Lachnospiraceae bacterium]MCH4064350.1 SUF system NifU family Fe-S cluster assembly protein [Lachnospiraceae bacterium]MCH4102925.1 SUF system NifU family Fe-S cluster assembly protein [Lachnospiraceae bacterium]MCI1308914.1 SUF system NifU family Fe-S cluster assembly protein [Lachnospiraceae bacterium]MCI1333456.1 SUF system NifU family Fe-S cluster assembly protein [Lachnospiraceae bacterium]